MTQTKSTVPATKEKIAAIESQEDRCLDKGFDKIWTMKLLKATWEDVCLCNKEKTDKSNIYWRDLVSREAYDRV